MINMKGATRVKKLIALILCLSICITCALPASAQSVTIACKMDTSYRTKYTDYSSRLPQIMRYVEYPFTATWGITFNEVFENIDDLPLDTCPLNYYVGCDPNHCGSACVDTLGTATHHKNMYKNHYWVRQHESMSGFDLMLTVTASKMCHIDDDTGEHSTSILGLAERTGQHAFVVNTTNMSNSSNDITAQVRVIQHELSHNYGCRDNDKDLGIKCVDGQPCIMSGGFDNHHGYYIDNIWCDNCKANFNPSLH